MVDVHAPGHEPCGDDRLRSVPGDRAAGRRDTDGGTAERLREVAPGRMRSWAVGYVVAMVVLSALSGFLVDGERDFLVAWIYVGGMLALPALLVTWMVARRELGEMPGGWAWCWGLVWIYIDGLGLLHITARPDSILRDLSVPAVIPPMVFVGAAVVALGRRQHATLAPARVLRTTAGAIVVLGGATAVLLGPQLVSSEHGWLARPAALVGVVTTAGALASVWHQWRAGWPTHPLNRLGLVAVSVGAVTAWSVTAQALSGFDLPVPPLLALQAATMGLLLFVPLYAPRIVSDDAPRRSSLGVVSQEWLAEAPDEDGVLPRRLRRPTIVYIAVTAPLIGLAGATIEGRDSFLMAWVYTSAVYSTPAMVLTWAAARRARFQATGWRLWFLGVVALYLNGAGILLATVGDVRVTPVLGLIAVTPCVALFGAAGIAMMRARSGSRTLWIDAIETQIVVTLVLFGLLLVVGDRIWTAGDTWFTVPTAVVAVSVTAGLVWTVIMYARVPHASRELEALGLVLSVTSTVNAWAMLAQSVRGFDLPSGPLLFLQAVTMGLLLLVPLYVPRSAPAGLERLPPHAQVRHGRVVVGITAAALPVLFALAQWREADLSWAPEAFTVVLATLVVLALVRQLLGSVETRRLYRLVTEAADERRRLLAEVMRSVDEDRHRVASQLHDQAIFSFVAFESMTRTASDGPPGAPSVLAGVSARVRDDLAGQAEALRRLMLAVRPLSAPGARSQAARLASPIRAYVDSLSGDTSHPTLEISVDDDVHVDWTTETILLRIVQEAVGNTVRHANAQTLRVTVAAEDGQLGVTVSDDGDGFDPAAVRHESGLATMRNFAALAGASLHVESRTGEGTTVRVRFGDDADDRSDATGADATSGGRPRLTLAPDPGPA